MIEKLFQIVPSKNSELVQKIVNILFQLSLYFEQTHDLKNIKDEKFQSKNSNFDIHTSTSQIRDAVSSMMKEKNLDLKINFENDCPPSIFGDYRRFQQILLNVFYVAI